MTEIQQVPADIAGKRNHKKTLQTIVKYFMKKESDNIRKSFIDDKMKKLVDKKRHT